MLEAHGLCKSYGSRAVVSDLSLSVRAGEIVGLLGPNGAGKSTTVAMLCGLVAADRGQVFVGEGASRQTLTEDSREPKRRIGVVPQELSIYENLGAAANLELFGALYGLSGELLKERVDAALKLVGLADRAKDKPSTFSGGMKRR
ncbi:MAG: ABC transporter ATP-binding protein, partial [Caldimonas sp.]